jgi:hypothetical protein
MTTKRTIMENEQMSIELHYQSKQTEKLLGRNTVSKRRNGVCREGGRGPAQGITAETSVYAVLPLCDLLADPPLSWTVMSGA